MSSGKPAAGRRHAAAVAAIILWAALAVALWWYPARYRIGTDGVVRERPIPLYAKACGYLYRDWAYRDIVREAVSGAPDDGRKAARVLSWTVTHVQRGVPPGLAVVDDHPLNIVIRGYGTDDQLQDVFTILCSYAGLPAGMEKCYSADRSRHIVLSFVKVDGRWLVFDAARNRTFRNMKGAAADTADCAAGAVALSGADAETYGPYLRSAGAVDPASLTRADEQMPTRRLQAEARKLFRVRTEAAGNHDK